MNNFCLYPPPVLKCFCKDLLMTPTTPLQASFTATPLPIHHPFNPPIKMLIIHWGVVLLMCLQYVSSICHVQEMIVDRTEIVLYTQEWSVYRQHFYLNYEKSKSKRECSWAFLHWLKRSHWNFRPRVASDNSFLWNLKCLKNNFVSFKKYKWSPLF